MNVYASMSGTVFRILVQPGDQVNPGDEVVILESMKMEIPITAEEGGTVKEVRVSEGEFVQEGDVVVVME